VLAFAASSACFGQVGTSNTVTADPPVPHPPAQPEKVQLFTDLQFADFNPKTFQMTPPPGAAHRHWAKIVLVGDFFITAGRQFDRTAHMSIGNTLVYFGTTAEPSQSFGPTWHFERDLTEYSALFKTAQPGLVDIGNLVNSTFTSIIHGSAYLLFYPGEPARDLPDVVIGLPSTPEATQDLHPNSNTLTAIVTLPQNIEHAYLDVFAQSQGSDEFWYANVPNDVAQELVSNGGTAFREVEISIDSQPAGVAPVYPWIYTGGVDPYLWRPIPGVQTLNFVPYRLDLTPFAGLLNDGQPHTIALSVFNNNDYFRLSATLFLHLDRFSDHVTGALVKNTTGAGPTPVIQENIVTTGGFPGGTINTQSSRQYVIEGYIFTSHGLVDTTVTQKVDFSNFQQFTISASQYVQDINQNTVLDTTTKTQSWSGVVQSERKASYPLIMDISQLLNADGSGSQLTTVNQGLKVSDSGSFDGFSFYASNLSNQVNSTDTIQFDSSFHILSNSGQQSSQNYSFADTLGHFYNRTLTATNNVLTSDTGGR
jgi:Peptide N-acetyl-beta-D-glucosaminyl asparaginase amidase A